MGRIKARRVGTVNAGPAAQRRQGSQDCRFAARQGTHMVLGRSTPMQGGALQQRAPTAEEKAVKLR